MTLVPANHHASPAPDYLYRNDDACPPIALGKQLRLLSFNIQAGVASTRAHHYVTQSWKHVLPHAESLGNLDRIAQLASDFDIVALQEADGGSLRSRYVNQVEYLAAHGGFPFWYRQTNRNLGHLGQHSNGLLSKIEPVSVTEHKLPGLIPGRGVMMARYGHCDQPLVILLVHMALSRRVRTRQFAFLSEIANDYEHVILMGDLNCQPHSPELDALLANTRLEPPLNRSHTFPSWRPMRTLDHILATPSIKINSVEVLNHALSDHLPVAMEITLPSHLPLP